MRYILAVVLAAGVFTAAMGVMAVDSPPQQLGDYSIVYGYDSEAQTWQRYVPGRPDLTTLTNLEHGAGYVAQNNQGWNLVGYCEAPAVPVPTPEVTATPEPTPEVTSEPTPCPTCTPDWDGDGVPDYHDNCKFAFNPCQEDLDGDGKGDICDRDDDNDTIFDVIDNCPFDANPGQEDTDEDGIGDACEDTPIE